MTNINDELSEAEIKIKQYWNDIKRHILEGSNKWGLAGVYKEGAQKVLVFSTVIGLRFI